MGEEDSQKNKGSFGEFQNFMSIYQVLFVANKEMKFYLETN